MNHEFFVYFLLDWIPSTTRAIIYREAEKQCEGTIYREYSIPLTNGTFMIFLISTKLFSWVVIFNIEVILTSECHNDGGRTMKLKSSTKCLNTLELFLTPLGIICNEHSQNDHSITGIFTFITN